MNRFFKHTYFLLLFCFGLSLSACSKSNEAEDASTIQLVSTDPVMGATIDASTETISFVFDQLIYMADKAKITLNGVTVDASARGYTLLIYPGKMDYDTQYTLRVDKGAIKDKDNLLNKQEFSLSFHTSDKPLHPVVIRSVKDNGFLSVEGTQLVNQRGEAVILQGISFGWHNWWSRFYNKETVSWLTTDWKCGVLRAAIGVEPDGAYIQNPTKALECLYAVVDAAIANDIYVIVDWHSHNIRLEEAQGFFTLVANKYKAYPNIIYEIFNEPEQQSWSEVKAYSEAVIATIRAIDSKNLILVGSPQWDQAVDKAAADPIKGYNNLMYTLHFYAATHQQSLRDRATAALKSGLPLFVSECAGMEASGDGPINTQQWNAWRQWMSDNGISWAAWSIADKNETCSMIQNTASPVSNWADSDLKEWGKIVRNELRK